MLLSVIVPCYNEEENVPIFYEEMMKNSAFLEQENWSWKLFILMMVPRTIPQRRFGSFTKRMNGCIWCPFPATLARKQEFMRASRKQRGTMS